MRLGEKIKEKDKRESEEREVSLCARVCVRERVYVCVHKGVCSEVLYSPTWLTLDSASGGHRARRQHSEPPSLSK